MFRFIRINYRIAGNFRGYQFSQMLDFEVFRVLIFKDRVAQCAIALYAVKVVSKIFRGNKFRGFAPIRENSEN